MARSSSLKQTFSATCPVVASALHLNLTAQQPELSLDPFWVAVRLTNDQAFLGAGSSTASSSRAALLEATLAQATRAFSSSSSAQIGDIGFSSHNSQRFAQIRKYRGPVLTRNAKNQQPISELIRDFSD
ncbi:MAG: hypothetical protein IGS38_08590 [Synechococcales cyanobacterium M58_A2018_015]|nr:hypothetical protein [Synechococcales cyanobacterium M58_A2018_015]